MSFFSLSDINARDVARGENVENHEPIDSTCIFSDKNIVSSQSDGALYVGYFYNFKSTEM